MAAESGPNSSMSPKTAIRFPTLDILLKLSRTRPIAVGLALYTSLKISAPFAAFSHSVRFFVSFAVANPFESHYPLIGNNDQYQLRLCIGDIIGSWHWNRKRHLCITDFE